MITKEQYFWLILIYNSKQRYFNRNELCEVVNISSTNSKSYNQIIEILRNNFVVCIKYDFSNKIKIEINRDKLERLIRRTDYYKLNDEFIHKSTIGAVTG